MHNYNTWMYINVVFSLLEKKVPFCSSLKALSTDTSFMTGIVSLWIVSIEINHWIDVSMQVQGTHFPMGSEWPMQAINILASYIIISTNDYVQQGGYLYTHNTRVHLYVRVIVFMAWWEYPDPPPSSGSRNKGNIQHACHKIRLEV